MRSIARKFLGSVGGNIALITAFALPAALMFAGAAVDFQRWHSARTSLQEFADMLALRGAKELSLAGVSSQQIEAAVRAAARAGGERLGVGAPGVGVVVDRTGAAVTVTLSTASPRALLLAHVAPYGEVMSVDSTAVARGGGNVCIIALKDKGDALNAQQAAAIDASACAILSNSVDPSSIIAKDQATLKAAVICSAGGYEGNANRFAPSAPLTDCPKTPDPLAERAPPPVGGCDVSDFEVGVSAADAKADNGQVIVTRLTPGVFCGGLKILDFASVDFDPGVYVIKDGPLLVGKKSRLAGANVGFYLVGPDSTFKFEKDATITLSAPKIGPLAGILFFEDRAAPLDRNHVILSEDARELLGTIYLSRGNLVIDTQKPVADASAYTAIVARRLELKGKPTLVINANYNLTDVPVPAGLGPVGADIYLRN